MNMKKVLCIFLTVLLLSSVAVNTFSATVTYDSAYNKLLAFGLVEETDKLFSNGTVSRSLFAKYTMRVKGLSKETASSKDYVNPFFDIDNDENEWAIIAAANMGIISGTTEGYYEPNKKITFAQAVKVFICALGYGEIANHYGGYPTGYLQIANQIGLVKGVSAANDGALSWEAFIRLYYNALNTDIMKGVGVVVNGSASDSVYSSTAGETPLTTYYEIYKAEGILTSNEYTSLYGDSEVGDDAVLIAGGNYKIGSTTAYDLIGYYVEAYYKENTAGVRTLVYIATDDVKNKVYYTKTEDIVPGSASMTAFSYYKSEDAMEKLVISSTASLIYNGALVALTPAVLCPENGEVTLIDNNRDDVIDVIHVMNYVSFFINKIAPNTYSLIGPDNQVVDLDPNDINYDVVIENDGIVTGFEDIITKQVVSYATYPKSTKYIKYIKVSSDYVKGTVDMLSDGYKATIADEEHKYASNVNMQLGVEGTYYKDFLGTIVAYESGKSFVYGFINDLLPKSTLSGGIVAHVLSENNNWIELTVANKVKVDGVVMACTAFYELHKDDYRQLVRYNVDTDGKIKEIDFAETITSDTTQTQIDSMIENNTFRLSTTLASGEYSKTPQSFGGKVNMLPSKTSVFIVGTEDEKYDMTKFRVTTNSSLQSSSYISYTNVRAYDMDAVSIASAIVMNESLPKVTKSSTAYLVDSVITMLDSDKVPVKGIKAYIDDETPVTLQVREGLDVSDIKKGDVIQIATKNGQIANIIKRFDIDEVGINKTFTGSGSAPTSTYLFFGAEVTALDMVNRKAKLNCGALSASYDFGSLSTVWVYDVDADILTKGSILDLREGDYIFARGGSIGISNLIIFRQFEGGM